MAKDIKKTGFSKSTSSFDDDDETEPETVAVEGGEAAPPTTSPTFTVTIEGSGTTPIIGKDGAVRTVERGVPIEVSAEELAYLEKADLPYEKSGKGKDKSK